MDTNGPVWRNWAGTHSAPDARVVAPASEEELVSAVREAVSQGTRVRAAGAGHSFSALVPTDGVIVDTAALQGITGIDTERRRARMLAGTRLHTLGDPLWEAGLALHNQGDIDQQAIAGALSTATHGSGIDLTSFSSKLTWVRMIDGRGEIVEIDEGDMRALRAARTALGTMGVFLEVEIEVSEAYLLEERISYPSWEETVREWDSDVRGHRHYSLQWCPYPDSGGFFGLEPPPEGTFENRSFTKKYRALAPGEQPLSGGGSRVDRSYRIYPGDYSIPYREMEYFIDERDGLAATSELRRLLLEEFPQERHPIEVRWVKQEDPYLAPAYGRDSAVVSVCSRPESDYVPYFLAAHELLRSYGARGHWGKSHFFTAEEVRASYPEFDAFARIRAEFDPRGLFLNDMTREYFEG